MNAEQQKLALSCEPLARWVLSQFLKHKPQALRVHPAELESAAMLGLCLAADAYTEDKGEFPTYARTCVRNLLIDTMIAELNRNKRRRVKEPLYDIHRSDVNTIDEASKLQRSIRVRQALRESTNMKSAGMIRRVYFGGEIPRVVGESFGVSKQAVQCRIKSAFKRLRDNKILLSEYYELCA